MTHEMLVGLHVTDEANYQRYRDAMSPLLAAHEGGFRYDFTVGRVLRSEATHPINRVFTIWFGSRAQRDAFFAHPDYLAIKARWFAGAVAGTTVIAEYER